MHLSLLKPRKALNKAFLKVKPNRSDMERFKAHLIALLEQTNDTESEEFHKNLVSDFLKKTYYDPSHFINTKGRNDLVIHNGPKASNTVGVILETKKPTNKSEMPTAEKLNTKAFHELVLYYMRERIAQKNLEIKHLIITNIYEWFIFDVSVFERLFAQNKSFIKQFEDFEAGRLADTKTDFFYRHVAGPFMDDITQEVEFTHFNLQDYQKPLRNDDKQDDRKLITLYKLLSPEHLLKLPFANDSNSLDKRFYSELLHIIGLTETKQGGKKLIERNAEGQRNEGSLLENAILQLDSLDKISRLDKPSQYGANQQERLFNVGLELCISWMNRILFLKLMEAQLLSYHKKDKSYEFLSYDKIHNYDALNKLFFQVLARRHEDRPDSVNRLFHKVPYLNSSLFEPNELEHTTLLISNLEDDYTLPLYTSTVLKDDRGKRRTGSMNTLQYLFEFLNAYDFSSEGSEEIQEENKSLINASVLGLIFEKINGYKDGSFFTPGFITMYMCRETLRRAVVQKFNEAKGWNCQTTDELYDKIEDRQEANEIVNSLKICDPAVGSGHFLVSALNEIIAIKNDLRILQDRQGKRLKEYLVEVVNDELVITDEEGQLFDYRPGSPESQRVQEALFHEKQTLIENCLFGVDINPNSVKICRLRLWIELLKSAYYKTDDVKPQGLAAPVAAQLETLPNIDINIKCGNSLVSRFALDANLGQALKKSKWTIDSYRVAVATYRNAENKEQKREMERIITSIKGDFRSEISANDPKLKRLSKLKGELFTLTNQTALFEQTQKEKAQWNKKVKKLTDDLQSLETEIEEIKSNKIYENAFEWRFEFPEVLNANGDFVGFDVVIGNPPYIRIQDLVFNSGDLVEYYNSNYETTGKGNYDLYVPFVEKGINLLKEAGQMCFIMPHKFINANYGSQIRGYIGGQKLLERMVHFGANQIFEDATTYTGLFFLSKKNNDTVKVSFVDNIEKFQKDREIDFEESPSEFLSSESWMFFDRNSSSILKKLNESKITLETLAERIFQGVKTSADKIYILQLQGDLGEHYKVYCRENDKVYHLEKEHLYPLIKGGNSRPYHISEGDLMLLFPYQNGQLVTAENLKATTPMTYDFLIEHKSYLEGRENNKMIGSKWYGYVYPKALNIISEKKIFTPDIAPSPRFSFDENGKYTFTGGAAGGYGIIPKKEEDFKYLLGVLNSKIAFWFIQKTSTQMRGGWYSFEARYIKNIPFPSVDPANKAMIEKTVDQIIYLKNYDPTTDTTALEQEIDRLVYELYGLTEEEIGIVEGAS